MREIENRMAVDSEWPEAPLQAPERLCGPGYTEITTGVFVPEEDAYSCALERLSPDENLRKEFVEWFYSGNRVREGSYGTD